MTVLVVEDDRKIANLLERRLSENGRRVTLAADGREGTKMMLNAALLAMFSSRA
jgi:DNA-binding response OmpR family regulator